MEKEEERTGCSDCTLLRRIQRYPKVTRAKLREHYLNEKHQNGIGTTGATVTWVFRCSTSRISACSPSNSLLDFVATRTNLKMVMVMLVMAVMIEVKVQTDGMRVPHQQIWSFFPRCFFDMKPLHLREGDFFDAWHEAGGHCPTLRSTRPPETQANVSCVFWVDLFPR